MSYDTVAFILAGPFFIAILVGSILLKRAFSLRKFLPEEFALAFAWVFVVGSLIWLAVYLSDSTLLGFGTPWTWLAAAHFMFAGFGALTITALSCSVVADSRMRRVLRTLLIAHPIAYLITAAGISGYPFCDELGASCYLLIFTTEFWAVNFGKPNRMALYPRLLLTLALAVPVLTLMPAEAWAFGRPIFDLAEMVQYHGIVNAVGHVGLGLIAFFWGRPPLQ
ncbi:MAG: YndJ family transporter [Bdellovibrionales bacterium]|nr:YndJ family transporter [Bdellovibrionales bacterium]